VKVPRSLPRPVAGALIPTLIAAAWDDDTRLMLGLAAYAGLRRTEIANLSWDDVDLSSTPAQLVVRNGKGKKDRVVPIHPALVVLMRGRRRVGPVFRLGPAAVAGRIKRHLALCGIEATPHQLRHSFGTELARISGGNLLLVQELMGHEDVSTSRGYVRWSGEGAEIVKGMYGGVA
jgi:integrase